MEPQEQQAQVGAVSSRLVPAELFAGLFDVQVSPPMSCTPTQCCGRLGELPYQVRAMAEALPEFMNDALSTFNDAALAILREFIEPMDTQPPPAILYHYTDGAGLKGILESGTLWLSDIFSLNDPSELRHGFSQLVAILDKRSKSGPPETRIFAKDFHNFLKDGLDRSAHYFVLSFSSDVDDLSQWRAYADNGRGYALGFEGKALETCFTKDGAIPIPNCSTFNVEYKEAVLISLLERMIDRMWHLISLPRNKATPRDAINPYMKELSIRLALNGLSASLFFKHAGYISEKEFRFLKIYRGDEVPPGLKQRVRGTETVKYLEFEWRRAAAGSLKEIVVGPAAERPKGVKFAKECAKTSNYKRVRTIQSKIPYRAIG